MCVAVNYQMELLPNTTLFFAVFFDFLLTFTENFQPGGINYQIRNFPPSRRFDTDTNRFCPLTDAAVIQTAKRKPHQSKMEPMRPCAARSVSRNTRLIPRAVVMERSEYRWFVPVMKKLLTHTKPEQPHHPTGK